MTQIDFEAPPPKGYWRNHRGDLVHEANISVADRDMDEVVRKIHGFGADLAAQMWRFRDHTLDDICGFVDRVVERYGGKRGGRKGNVTLQSFDGRRKVQLAAAEHVVAGPEIAAAQAIIEECIEDWSERGNLKLRALVDQAFKRDATGEVSVSQLLRLRRIVIDDPRWREAQNAISDALRPTGKAEYVRLYHRAHPAHPWRQLSLHLATVARPADEPGDAGPAAALERRVRSAIEEARRSGMGEGAIRETLLEAKRRTKGERPTDSAAVPDRGQAGEESDIHLDGEAA